jgi:ABC-2 type transport system permease protein
MLSLPTFATCGYVWTIDQMPEAMVKVIKAFWPLIYFSRPFDEIIIKGLKFNDIKQNIIQMLIYTIAWMPIGIYFFKKRYNKPEKAEA